MYLDLIITKANFIFFLAQQLKTLLVMFKEKGLIKILKAELGESAREYDIIYSLVWIFSYR